MLRASLRPPFTAIADGIRFWRSYGVRIHRARVWCQCADGIRLRRLRNWQGRSVRLYRRALRGLRACPGFAEDGAGAMVMPGFAWRSRRAGRQGSPVRVSLSGDESLRARRALVQVTRPYRRLRAGFAVLAGALSLVGLLATLVACALSPTARARVFPADLAAGKPWVASNADLGYTASGTGPSTTGPAFFHTTSIEKPWLEIDLGDEHTVRSVLVENRADCCQERVLPLNVEIFDGRDWRLVAQRRTPFATWRYDIDPVRTRKVRLVRLGVGFFHLKRISIYGQ
jgi:hypothetical protein